MSKFNLGNFKKVDLTRSNKKLTLLFVLTILPFIIIGLYVLNEDDSTQQNDSTNDSLNRNLSNSSQTDENSEMQNKTVLTAELIDVAGNASTGTASITRTDNSIAHTITAQLPQPPTDQFYEGWIVQQVPLKFISTGILEYNGEDWVLEFSSNQPYRNYNFVVVTLETQLDDIPEAHIIEGLAK